MKRHRALRREVDAWRGSQAENSKLDDASLPFSQVEPASPSIASGCNRLEARSQEERADEMRRVLGSASLLRGIVKGSLIEDFHQTGASVSNARV
jgi:hypothetical protein